MKRARINTLLAVCALMGLSSCDNGSHVQKATPPGPHVNRERQDRNPMSKKLRVKIGSKAFTASLEDNPTTAKLKGLLPMSIDMSELNGNEKLYRLPNPL